MAQEGDHLAADRDGLYRPALVFKQMGQMFGLFGATMANRYKAIVDAIPSGEQPRK